MEGPPEVLLGLHHSPSVHLSPTLFVVVNASMLLWQSVQHTKHII